MIVERAKKILKALNSKIFPTNDDSFAAYLCKQCGHLSQMVCHYDGISGYSMIR